MAKSSTASPTTSTPRPGATSTRSAARSRSAPTTAAKCTSPAASWTWPTGSWRSGTPAASKRPPGPSPTTTLDAAGNPIWARDARGIETTRTFNVLNRPLSEHAGGKLRQAWRYIPYDDEDVDFLVHQSKNLFGRFEEARDADGLRFFEDDWDPEVDDTDRGSITDWLALPNLTDTTTIELSTSYDAAGHPVEQHFPEGLALRRSYDAAGHLARIEVDRDGTGYADAVTDLRTNARGQLSRLTHGNGVVTTREHDPDLERLGIVDSNGRLIDGPWRI